MKVIKECAKIDQSNIEQAVTVLREGGIIAYPTEAIYGLGCDPLNEVALSRLLTLKQRAVEKGLILVADHFEKLRPWVMSIPEDQLEVALSTWPGPFTWVFPANLSCVSSQIRGSHETVAVRVSAHPIIQALCASFGFPMVSTSANLSSQPPLRSAEAVKEYFGDGIDYIVDGVLGSSESPTEIREVMTGKLLRS